MMISLGTCRRRYVSRGQVGKSRLFFFFWPWVLFACIGIYKLLKFRISVLLCVNCCQILCSQRIILCAHVQLWSLVLPCFLLAAKKAWNVIIFSEEAWVNVLKQNKGQFQPAYMSTGSMEFKTGASDQNWAWSKW